MAAVVRSSFPGAVAISRRLSNQGARRENQVIVRSITVGNRGRQPAGRQGWRKAGEQVIVGAPAASRRAVRFRPSLHAGWGLIAWPNSSSTGRRGDGHRHHHRDRRCRLDARASGGTVPEIVPPQILVATTYPGADALTMEQAVASPIEQQMNGVDHMFVHAVDECQRQHDAAHRDVRFRDRRQHRSGQRAEPAGGSAGQSPPRGHQFGSTIRQSAGLRVGRGRVFAEALARLAVPRQTTHASGSSTCWLRVPAWARFRSSGPPTMPCASGSPGLDSQS